MRAWVTVLVVVALFLGGCAGSPDVNSTDDGDSEPPNGNTASPPGGSATSDPPDNLPASVVSVTDCRINPFAFPVEGEKVAAHVPPPYTTDGGTLGSLGLAFYQCAGVVIGNVTVEKDVSFAWTFVPVDPPGKWAGPPGTNHVFMTELFVPEALAGWFAERGFDPTVAAVTTVEGDGVEAVVEVEDGVLYEAVGYGRTGQPYSDSVLTRRHFSVGDGFRWIDDNATMRLSSMGDTVHLVASGGTLSDVSPAAGHLIGRSTPGEISTTWNFGGP